MPTIVNSGIHWCDANQVCHAASIAAGTDSDDSTADIIVNDGFANILGVNLRLDGRHNGAAKGATGDEASTWHYAGQCATGASPGY